MKQKSRVERIRQFSIACFLILGTFSSISHGQSSDEILRSLSEVTNAMLENPPAQDWLIWRRNYASYGHSPLNQITSSNIGDLSLAWDVELETGPNTPTPLVHDGVMYLLSTRDTLLAMDARNGNELWRYQHESSAAASSKIGIALHGNKVLMPTADLHVVALDSKTGAVLWDTGIEATQAGPLPYALRGAPVVAGDTLIQGVTATMVPGGGFIVGIDLESGDESWRFNTVARPGEPGGNTWNDIPLEQRSGGSVWVPGSYDAELDLVYFGLAPTYNTEPLLRPVNLNGVSNDALYTNSTIALRPGTGELVWYFQHIANDQWDLDWVYERQLIELDIGGVERKIVLTAGKMALYDALDAATGEYLFSIDLGLQNIVTAIDPETGAKTISPAATPNAEDTHLLCPFANGGRNWQSASYNPQSKILFLPIAEICMDGGPTGQGGILSTGAAMRPMPSPLAGSDGRFGRWQAVNVETQKLVWSHREVVPPTSAALSTAGGVVFIGALDESFKALDEATGVVLWETDLGDIPASFPITFQVGETQYVAVAIGTPTINANVWIGVVNGFLGGDDNVIRNLSRNGPALKVFALE
ncbi:MAG: PQQ-binding-like beta-propeller repeat protein [Pseudomonadales bacterium]|nr:PQQ-binding-like beta-propeller repeat protein [Pseudomonadales bacterium]